MPRNKLPRSFGGQIAVVTGASSGIGRRLAVKFAERGAIVVGLARRGDLLSELDKTLSKTSTPSSTIVCDVGDDNAFRDTLSSIEAEYGRIDILVNNAGIHHFTPVEDGLSVAFRDVLKVNFFGVVTGTLAVLPGMLDRGSGIIVNVSSDSARAPEPREAAYAASKAAVSGFSESVAHEVIARGVHVHVLYPAWVPTAMGLGPDGDTSLPPKGVRRTEEQVARLVLDRIGKSRMEINAALLPLMAPISRTIAPVLYQKAMRQRSR